MIKFRTILKQWCKYQKLSYNLNKKFNCVSAKKRVITGVYRIWGAKEENEIDELCNMINGLGKRYNRCLVMKLGMSKSNFELRILSTEDSN